MTCLQCCHCLEYLYAFVQRTDSIYPSGLCLPHQMQCQYQDQTLARHRPEQEARAGGSPALAASCQPHLHPALRQTGINTDRLLPLANTTSPKHAHTLLREACRATRTTTATTTACITPLRPAQRSHHLFTRPAATATAASFPRESAYVKHLHTLALSPKRRLPLASARPAAATPSA